MPREKIVGNEASVTTTLRLTTETVVRADVVARKAGITRAAVLRLALMKGITAMEVECGVPWVPLIRKTVEPDATPGGVENTEADPAKERDWVTPETAAPAGKGRGGKR